MASANFETTNGNAFRGEMSWYHHFTCRIFRDIHTVSLLKTTLSAQPLLGRNYLDIVMLCSTKPVHWHQSDCITYTKLTLMLCCQKADRKQCFLSNLDYSFTNNFPNIYLLCLYIHHCLTFSENTVVFGHIM